MKSPDSDSPPNDKSQAENDKSKTDQCPDTGAPYPGSKQMPQWTLGELPETPVFTWRNWIGMLGPGLVMGAAAIGGGEWTLGPKVTASYGGAMLWLATLSIFFQVFYNIEICRYTLYSGEPIFTGKFRLIPGPIFWVLLYVLVDWGSFFPYLVTNAAVPLYSLIMGELPPDALNLTVEKMTADGMTTMQIAEVQQAWWIHKGLTLGLFCLMLIPLIFGGKVYNSLKAVMSFKLVYVLGLLLFLGVFYSSWDSWTEIISGFVQFGNVPVKGTDAQGLPVVANLFTHYSETGSLPDINYSMVAYLCALAAIAGNGGLTNAPISNFVRDQGWGMGQHVGAIPSMVGGHGIELSHEGKVFLINPKSLERWRKWVWHVVREQLFVWLPACFVGVALPSILSVQFIARGTNTGDWNLATKTAEGVQQSIQAPPSDVLAGYLGLDYLLGSPFFGMMFFKAVLFCGLLVLMTSGISTADGFIRRWVDLLWTGMPKFRGMKGGGIRYVYFGVLVFYFVIGFTMLLLPQAPGVVTKIATTGYNFAFAFSSWHSLGVNLILLPKELRPNWFSRCVLAVSGVFFLFLGCMSTYTILMDIGWLPK